MSVMRMLFDKYDCDRGSFKHYYDRCYDQYMESVRFKELNILEIGCLDGKSIETWVEYFPNAQIYTGDTFERTPAEQVSILNHERVHWLKLDSMAEETPAYIREQWGDVEFDFIIDDGAHWPQANELTFKNFFPMLKKSGVYFIEDVWMLDDFPIFPPYIARKKTLFNMDVHNSLMSTINKFDVKKYDFKSQSVPDSYILRVKHND